MDAQNLLNFKAAAAANQPMLAMIRLITVLEEIEADIAVIKQNIPGVPNAPELSIGTPQPIVGSPAVPIAIPVPDELGSASSIKSNSDVTNQVTTSAPKQRPAKTAPLGSDKPVGTTAVTP